MFCWTPPSAEYIGGAALDQETLKVATAHAGFSFARFSKALEVKFCDPELGCVCACCARSAEKSGSRRSYRFECGWHRCRADPVRQNDFVWRPGTLHGGRLDIQRVLFNLHRRRLPTDVLVAKAQDYVNGGLVSQTGADGMMAVIRSERGDGGVANNAADGDDDAAVLAGAPRRLSRASRCRQVVRTTRPLTNSESTRTSSVSLSVATAPCGLWSKRQPALVRVGARPWTFTDECESIGRCHVLYSS